MFNKAKDLLKSLKKLQQQDKISTKKEDEIKCKSDYLQALKSMNEIETNTQTSSKGKQDN